jgi:hypothetical protein
MGRLRNIANAGFYPWLQDHFERVAAQLAGPGDDGQTWMLDPCAGEGIFAHFLAGHLGLKLATVEINRDRGRQCRTISDHHVTADALQAGCGHDQFAFLWLNPPFMKDAEARMEWRFLRRYRDALAPGGVLAYTIPGRTMLKDKAILAHLVRFYQDHRLFWLPEPNPYGQILYLGVRRVKKPSPLALPLT